MLNEKSTSQEIINEVTREQERVQYFKERFMGNSEKSKINKMKVEDALSEIARNGKVECETPASSMKKEQSEN